MKEPLLWDLLRVHGQQRSWMPYLRPGTGKRGWGCKARKRFREGTQIASELFPAIVIPLPLPPRGEHWGQPPKVPDSSTTAQHSRSTYCRKGPLRQLAPPLRPPGAKESTCRLPAAVRLPRTSCSLCNCARHPRRLVASTGTGTNSIGRTRSMALALQVPQAAASPAAFSVAILTRLLLPVTWVQLRPGHAPCSPPDRCRVTLPGAAELSPPFAILGFGGWRQFLQQSYNCLCFKPVYLTILNELNSKFSSLRQAGAALLTLWHYPLPSSSKCLPFIRTRFPPLYFFFTYCALPISVNRPWVVPCLW